MTPFAFPFASVIAAGASLAANAITNSQNRNLWQQANRYNTPSAQMSRFRQAGLNPHLIYTQTNEAAPTPTMQAPDLSSLSGMASELKEYQDIKESKGRIKNLDKTNEMLDEQIIGITLDNILKQKDINVRDVKNKEEINLIQQQAANLKKSLDLIQEQINKTIADTNLTNKQAENIDFENFISYMDIILKNKQIQLEIEKIGIEREKLQEMIRQFNESNWQKDLLYQFFEGLSGSGVRDLAKKLGVSLKSFIGEEITNDSVPAKWRGVQGYSKWKKNVEKWKNSH